MVIELILGALTSFANWLISLFPDVIMSNNLVTTIDSIYNIWHTASFIIPIGWITFCIAWMFLIYNVGFFVSIVNWVVRKIPTVD